MGQKIYHFGCLNPGSRATRARSFRFDGRLLHRDGSPSPVPLTEAETVVLRRLIERAGQLVTRDDLLEEPYGPKTENHIYEAVSKLRAYLGDKSRGAGKRRLIETMQRRGY